MQLLKIIILLLLFLLLLAFIVPATCPDNGDAQRSLTCTILKDVSSTLELFKKENGVYPTTQEGVKALVANPDIEEYPNYPAKPYYKKMPIDPWHNEIIYLQKGDGFTLLSYASDRKVGGEGWDKDILYPICEKE